MRDWETRVGSVGRSAALNSKLDVAQALDWRARRTGAELQELALVLGVQRMHRVPEPPHDRRLGRVALAVHGDALELMKVEYRRADRE